VQSLRRAPAHASRAEEPLCGEEPVRSKESLRRQPLRGEEEGEVEEPVRGEKSLRGGEPLRGKEPLRRQSLRGEEEIAGT
jgi:hypothetical protein